MAIKFVLVEIVLVETVLVGDPLYYKHATLSFFVGSQTQWTTNLFLTILKYASGYEILGQSLANLASKAEEP